MPPSAIDLRRGRVSEIGRIYLITAVTLDRVPLFEDLALARTTIAHLRHADAHGRSKTLAWVLMPDHRHWLVQLAAGDLSRLVAGFKAGSASSSCCACGCASCFGSCVGWGAGCAQAGSARKAAAANSAA